MSPTPRLKSPAFVPFTHHVASALLLRQSLYDYAASTPTAMSQAIAVVCFTGMAQPSTLTKTYAGWGMVAAILVALFLWFVYATFVVYPTARLFTWRRFGYKRLLRCLGFAQAPGLLNLFAYLTDAPLPAWTSILIWSWLLAATVAALRSALSVTLAKAAVVGIVVFALWWTVGYVNQLFIVFPTA